jgi:hypothetical protein
LALTGCGKNDKINYFFGILFKAAAQKALDRSVYSARRSPIYLQFEG